MIRLRQGVVVAGRYTLVRQLARGGMGSVWLARHRDLDLDVTVKFMASSIVESTEARIRFEREAKVAARLRSQYVVQVHDYGVEDETPYIVMELLNGEALNARLDRETRLSLPVAAQLATQICKALGTAHEAGLVHRDLKPSNIFLALKDGDEVVKVLDFGVAKAGGVRDVSANTETGVLLGTVQYMSPEQLRSSRSVDSRSDLWSLGVILYRALTGRLPFPGGSEVELMVRISNDPIPPPSSVAPDLSPRVDAFFKRALAREFQDRFQSATEMSEAISALLIEERTASPRRAAPPLVQTLVLPPTPPSEMPSSFKDPFQAQPTPAPHAPMTESFAPISRASAPHTPPFVGATLGSAVASAITAPGVGQSLPRSFEPTAAPPPVAKQSRWQLWFAAGAVTLAITVNIAVRYRTNPPEPDAASKATSSPPAPPSTQTAIHGDPPPATPAPPSVTPIATATVDASSAPAVLPAPRATGQPRQPSPRAPRPGAAKPNPLDRQD